MRGDQDRDPEDERVERASASEHGAEIREIQEDQGPDILGKIEEEETDNLVSDANKLLAEDEERRKGETLQS